MAAARPVEVLADKPQILAVDLPLPVIGEDMTIRGTGLTSALDPHSVCVVLIGATPRDATPTKLSSGAEELKLQVPTDTTAGKLNVKVRTPRLTESDAVEVTFKAG